MGWRSPSCFVGEARVVLWERGERGVKKENRPSLEDV